MESAILAGASIGFLGSFHCIGMCGAIALSLPVSHQNGLYRTLHIFLYNLGRASSYALMGAVLGFIGNQFLIHGYQQLISILAGILILVFLVLSRFFNTEKFFLGGITNTLKKALGSLLKSTNTSSFFLIGMLNGFLPCGLVYVAVASALATTSILHGAVLMFSFGLGTIPLMASLMFLGNVISFSMRKKMSVIVPYFIAFTAVLLILRGLNLGIPYISPSFSTESSVAPVSCHK